MLLAIDIGNTQTVIGLFKKDKVLASWRMVTPKYETSDEIAAAVFNFLKNSKFDPGDIENIAISCVVPSILDEIIKMSRRYFNQTPFVVTGNIRSDLIIKYDYPAEIGADRIANSVAAKELYGYPAIVVDFGTATTFDILTPGGEYVGGVIAPGIEISSEALFSNAARLSKVDLNWPESVVGKNTNDGVRAGILYGFLGQADFIIEKIIEELNKNYKDFKPEIIATGGLAFLMTGKSKWFKTFDPDLTLKGLRILFDKNK
jgi:type III pantothenate kinase